MSIKLCFLVFWLTYDWFKMFHLLCWMFSSPPSPHPSFDLSCPAAPSPPLPVLTPANILFSLGWHFHPADIFTRPTFSLSWYFHSANIFTWPTFSLSDNVIAVFYPICWSIFLAHLGVVEGALLVDGVHAEVDGRARHAVKVARVVAHRTVPCGIWQRIGNGIGI